MTDERLAGAGVATLVTTDATPRAAGSGVAALVTASTATPHTAGIGAAVLVRASTIPDNLVAGLGTAVLVRTRPVYGTDWNRAGGRSRSGTAVASWEPAVAPIPATLEPGQAVIAATAFAPITYTADGRPVVDAATATAPRLRTRIVVGGHDITFFRDIPTPPLRYELVEPLGYGAATLRLPQIAACFERPGQGPLTWCKPGKRVVAQRVDDETGAVVATDYIGVVIAYDTRGADLVLQIGGQAHGRAVLRYKPIPIFRQEFDLGRLAFRAVRELGLSSKPFLGPETGIRMGRFGAMNHLDYIHELVARGWTRSGNQWSIMPDADNVYRIARKDTTTIRATVYFDDARCVQALRRDIAEEPNRIFANGVTPDGRRVRGAIYPGLIQGRAPEYPLLSGAAFGQGTTDADTDTGDGVTVMIGRLQVVGYLDRRDAPGGYDAHVTKAIRHIQEDADLAVTGNMNQNTWAALYDLGATGFSLSWSRIIPMAQRSYTRKWKRSGSGAIMGRNPNHDPSRLVVDASIDMGPGFTRSQIKEWSDAELDNGREDNWVGTITVNTGAVIAGEHVPGTPITGASLLDARALRAGDNVWAPLWDGGTLLHVSAVSVDDDTLTLAVDTRARDAMKVWEIIRRNRESRQNPARLWLRDHRASGVDHDAIDEWDEVGGVLGDEIEVAAHTWTVFPVVAGQEGAVRSLRVRTNPDAEYVMAVFGRKISPTRLRRLIGNPLHKTGAKLWVKESVRDQLDAENVLLYVAGDDEEPCGYFPKTKTSEADDGDAGVVAPLTGRWEDDAGFPYHTFDKPVLYVAVYADRATTIPAGRIMWNQLESGA